MPKTTVTVSLIDQDGNALAIVKRVRKALRQAHIDAALIQAYQKDALAGNYDHLLQVTMEYVTII